MTQIQNDSVLNMNSRESIKRLLFGLFILIITVLIIIVISIAELSRWWRLPLIIPLYLAGLGFFQFKEKT